MPFLLLLLLILLLLLVLSLPLPLQLRKYQMFSSGSSWLYIQNGSDQDVEMQRISQLDTEHTYVT